MTVKPHQIQLELILQLLSYRKLLKWKFQYSLKNMSSQTHYQMQQRQQTWDKEDDECEETETAQHNAKSEKLLAFLKKAFPHHSSKNIEQALQLFNEESSLRELEDEDEEEEAYPVSYKRRISKQNPIYKTLAEQATRFEQQKLIAKLFCQSGYNYTLAQYFYPGMSKQAYRAHIIAITNQALNEIKNYFKLECVMKVDRIEKEEKKNLRNQLIRVKEWLGNKDPTQLDTYYKFIQRHYEQKKVDLQYKDVIKLYKTLLTIAKGPQTLPEELNQDRNRPLNCRPMMIDSTELNEQCKGNNIKYSVIDERRIINSYISIKSANRMYELLEEQYGNHGLITKWTKKNLRIQFRSLLCRAIRKLILSAQKYIVGSRDQKNNEIQPTIQNINKLMQAEDSFKLKCQLLKFYLRESTKRVEIQYLLKSVRKFYGRSEIIQWVDIPKLEDADNDNICIIDEEEGQPINQIICIDD